jgi:hypothetical protein
MSRIENFGKTVFFIIMEQTHQLWVCLENIKLIYCGKDSYSRRKWIGGSAFVQPIATEGWLRGFLVESKSQKHFKVQTVFLGCRKNKGR